jgi:predicted TIM-barrel fold metal-dependent hydrolase
MGQLNDVLVDCHVHFWDLKHDELTYEWLGPDAVHPILGVIDAIKTVRYDVDALHAESRFAGVGAAVHVQSAVGTADPVKETEWLTEMAMHSPVPFVLIAGTDLNAEDVRGQIERHAASPLLRGVRDYGRTGYLHDPAFRRGVGVLGELDLVLDLDCAWEDMQTARDVALENPSTTIVLEHIGYPRDTVDPEYFARWKTGILAIAEAPNVFCKISGLGMNRAGWTTDGLVPWVDHCIEAFGPERCVFGSNWPVDRLWGSYDAYASAFRELISHYSEDEQRLMLHDVAQRIYRITEINPR